MDFQLKKLGNGTSVISFDDMPGEDFNVTEQDSNGIIYITYFGKAFYKYVNGDETDFCRIYKCLKNFN